MYKDIIRNSVTSVLDIKNKGLRDQDSLIDYGLNSITLIQLVVNLELSTKISIGLENIAVVDFQSVNTLNAKLMELKTK